MIVNLVAYWFIGLPLGWLLGVHVGWGAAGLWIGLCVGLILLGSILLAVWHGAMKKSKFKMQSCPT
jgi:MATE family multidrug resistance protein